MTSWFKEFKEGVSTSKSFIEERKKGQHTDEENTYLSFIDHVLNHEGDVIDQLAGEYRKMLSNPSNIKAMQKGLSLILGKGRVPGEFWVVGNSEVSVQGINQTHTIDLGDLIAFISESPEIPKLKKPSDVSCYVMSCLSKSIVAFITQNLDMLTAPIRTSIANNTKPSDMSPPYSGQKGEMIRNLLKQTMQYPIAQQLMTTHGGDAFPSIMNGVVEDFTVAKVAVLQRAANEAFLTGQIAPVINGMKELAGQGADAISAKSAKHPCEQE